jgi:hypothetical protein
MFARTVIMLLCAASISFYVRFLIALCRERKTPPIGYWVRVRPGSGEESTPELRKRDRPVTRAA